LRFGLTHIETGQLARSDPYSYTAHGEPWINHEWLTEWIFGVIYLAAGVAGLIGLRAALLLLCVLAMASIVWRRRLAAPIALAWAIFGCLILAEFFRVRPQMFTFAFMAILLMICDRYRPERRWILWLVPLLMALWANLHAGFVAGLGIFGIHWLEFVWSARQRSDRRMVYTSLLLVLAATLVATLINPYGWRYWSFVWYAVTLPRPAITEWQSIFLQNGVVFACYLVAVIVPAYCWLCSSRRLAWAETVIFALGVILAARHVRHFPFLLLFGTVLLARRAPETRGALLPYWNDLTCRLSSWQRTRLISVLVVLFALCGGVSRYVNESRIASQCGGITVASAGYPVRAVEFLRRNEIAGNLDCGFNWGEYCLFHLYPSCLVFCDGRYETVYPAKITQLAMAPGGDDTRWRRRIDDYHTQLVLASLNDPFGCWVAGHPEFVEIYRDETARVFIRRAPNAEPILRAHQAGELIQPEPVGALVPFPA
jgi:hypothetical protein